jgi:dienelactone hydrolase
MTQTPDASTTKDGRTRVRHGQLAYELPSYATLGEWKARAAHLRRRIRVSAGLWPTPERCPLAPRVTGRVEHEGYTIENVYLQSWPGFYVCGNLYRPQGAGPFPGVLCPHGHWSRGRLHDEERGSIPARCIGFARQGIVALAYDMIGYNDSGVQIAGRAGEDLGDGGPETGAHRGHFRGRRAALWGVSLLGLQLWNSVRALDYLASLPGVDAGRLGCTGASGGGTQTFLLAAVDERVRVAAPVNMISAHFQGGCDCENAANLRLDATNVEIGALMAPRPLLMVSATGDWTVNTPEVEFPAVQAIYRLYGAEERVATAQVDAPHNYNQASREAVYAWFGRWLLGEEGEAPRERPYVLDPPERMRVFAGPADLPAGALSPPELTEQRIAGAQAQIEALQPRDAATLHAYRETMGVAYRYALNATLPHEGELAVQGREAVEQGGYTAQALLLGRASAGERTPALLLEPAEGALGAALVVHGEGTAAALAFGAQALAEHPLDPTPGSLVAALLERGLAVLTLDAYGTGSASDLAALAGLERDRSVPHFECFNRTDAALRVQDVLTGLGALRARVDRRQAVHLVGLGQAGLWCLLARALAGATVGRTVVDGALFACDDDGAWAGSLYLPLLRRAGDLRTAVALAAPGPLWVHNAAPDFPAAWCRQAFRAAGAADALHVRGKPADATAIAGWVAGV